MNSIRKINYFLLAFLSVFTHSCINQRSNSITHGIKKTALGDIPARIAVLPATYFSPKGKKIGSLPKKTALKKLKLIDKYIIRSFKNQAYMRGYSPKAVKEKLSSKDSLVTLGEAMSFWNTNNQEPKCYDCKDPVTYYETVLQNNKEWILCLNKISRTLNYSDTVLIPLIHDGFAEQKNSRGVLTSQRTASFSLILLDTNNAQIIWSGGTHSTKTHQIIPHNNLNKNKYPPYPEWDIVINDLMNENLWRDFPGRTLISQPSRDHSY